MKQKIIPPPFNAPEKLEVSIVVPALNEELTIGEFVDWCWEGLSRSGVKGEILIVDSSSDRTGQIAEIRGARVIKTSRKGLGQAYIDAIPHINGDFVIMGDCDLTYDFRELGNFVTSYKSGSEFVMGSRFKGSIEVGAMPKLHQYFGTPLTTWILNSIYGSKFSDIHCGMRGISLAGLKKMNLTSSGWEYASEMVLKAKKLNLSIDEVPVRFYKDREGRLSHHKRSGFLSPWKAGWVNLKVMLVFSAEKFLKWPGFAFLLTGSVLTAITIIDYTFGGRMGFGSATLLVSMTAMAIGALLIQLGMIPSLLHKFSTQFEQSFSKLANYNRGMVTSGLLFVGSVASFGVFISGFTSFGLAPDSLFPAVLGAQLMLLSGITFSSTLLLELIRRNVPPE
jgi:glycosyltransferase involved in cell wall biosynthesis